MATRTGSESVWRMPSTVMSSTDGWYRGLISLHHTRAHSYSSIVHMFRTNESNSLPLPSDPEARLNAAQGSHIMSSKLKGKVAVVTGASKGIGAAIAKSLAAEGASVVVNYASSKSGADKVVAAITAAGGKAVAVPGDVSKPEDAQGIIAAAIKNYGRLDILVNNSGVYEFSPIDTITVESFHKLFNINVPGFRRLRLAHRRTTPRQRRPALNPTCILKRLPRPCPCDSCRDRAGLLILLVWSGHSCPLLLTSLLPRIFWHRNGTIPLHSIP